jgi:hypothetical protein
MPMVLPREKGNKPPGKGEDIFATLAKGWNENLDDI